MILITNKYVCHQKVHIQMPSYMTPNSWDRVLNSKNLGGKIDRSPLKVKRNHFKDNDNNCLGVYICTKKKDVLLYLSLHVLFGRKK